jgi:hypothetical protein
MMAERSVAHTPGPWTVTENTRERTVQIDTANGRGTVVQPRAISWKPDAALIAAAPDLLAALEQAERRICGDSGCDDPEHGYYRAAIAKARG